MTSLRDVSLAEAGKHGSLNEYAFFDKVRVVKFSPLCALFSDPNTLSKKLIEIWFYRPLNHAGAESFEEHGSL